MQTLLQLQSGQLQGAVSLKLQEQLTHFPTEIFELVDTLEVLDLSQNQITELPADFGRLYKLKILFCSDNQFTVLPEVLSDCLQLDTVGFKANSIHTVPPRSLNRNLRWLILTNNRIAELPREIGSCHRLQKLMLAGNQLAALPDTLSQCLNLSLLRISANRLLELPNWLLSLPRLAWLAFSGNLFSIRVKANTQNLISWDDLEIQQLLGEGASGTIYKGVLCIVGEVKAVAVKVFKGAITSDGFPHDEMQSFIAAGTHYGLVQLIGLVHGHPEGKQGIVMELIDSKYYNLGGPPSLDSCTRDVFADGKKLTLKQVLQIATTTAAVGQHLHSKGIMHGDLYAHNTLIDNEGHTLIGDFGAASMYETNRYMLAHALERIEVCAFSYLLDDLLHLCEEDAKGITFRNLHNLKEASQLHQVQLRPSFRELHQELSKISSCF